MTLNFRHVQCFTIPLPFSTNIRSGASRTTYHLYFPNNIANAVSLDFSFVNVNFFYIHGDNGSGILYVIETNKHLNTMQNHCVVQIRLHILAISLLRTTASFIKEQPVFLLESGPIGRQNDT